MAQTSTAGLTIADGSFDWSTGVDSSKTRTVASDLFPNGVKRTQLVWLNNASVRGGGITQRTGWQPLVKIIMAGRWQGGILYEPDGANPYLVCSISGIIYRVLLEAPFTITDLSAGDPALQNPPDAEIAFFVQAENFLVIQAGDYFTPGPVVAGKTDTVGRTLPLFWNGISLRRSIGITNPAPAVAPNQNEIPAATAMDYYGNRIWYAQARSVAAGDIAGGPSGTPGYRYRDAVLSVTENPLCFGGDGFSLPTNAGNIRAIKHSANLNAALGQGQLHIFTRRTVYELIVPITRTDWINANINNGPQLNVVQLVNGAVGDRAVVPINGDLFYLSFDPAVRSLLVAVKNFGQWGNTPVSQNEQRILERNDRGLMRFSSGVEFDNRLLFTALPEVAGDAVNVIHRGIMPLDFDIVSSLEERRAPAWEGAHDGLQVLQLFSGDFGGNPRAFAANISDVDGSINVWEITRDSRTENGDNRIVWGPEFPAFTWSPAGYEFKIKQLSGGECWIDKISGTVDLDVYYRVDAEPCWRHWFHHSLCAKRCEDEESWDSAYPCEPYREGYSFPVVFPEPKGYCDSMMVRPSTIGYQFQVKIMLKGWCRITGLMLYALPKEKMQYQWIACPPNTRQGMATLPFVPSALPFARPPTPPPAPTLPSKATSPSPGIGAGDISVSSPVLSWVNGGGATSYNVWFNGAFQGNQVGTTFNLGVLSYATAYSWRIDSVNDAGTTTGDTWTFTTESAPGPSFSYTPDTATITWTDVPGGAGQTGALADFLANADIATVSDVSINGQGITSVSNLNLLPALVTFDCGNNPSLDTLDFAGCTTIINLDCSNCGFVTLDPSPCTNLDTFNCRDNLSMTTLTLTGLSLMVELDCSNCPMLTALTLTDCTGLNILDCGACTSFLSLDVSPCINLTTLICNAIGLTALDVSACSVLAALICDSNSLADLRIGNSASYVFVSAGFNALPANPGGAPEGINDILTRLEANCIANLGFCDLGGGTSAAPDAGPPDGATAKANLLGAGWFVLTN